jgi:transcriptional regulator with XRE-family HTH domain
MVLPMADFAERLRAEIEYAGYNQKEFSVKAGIKKRALDMYLGKQKSIPPADIAVKLASTLGVSVEYLVTGKERKNSRIAGRRQKETENGMLTHKKFDDLLNDLAMLPEEVFLPVKALIKAIAKQNRQ